MSAKSADVPRQVCSSRQEWDAVWTSHVVLVNGREAKDIENECEAYWSPGLVVVIPPGILGPLAMESMANTFAKLSKFYGKARRITCGTPMGRDLATLLYESFYCVEFVNTNGQTQIVDDGNERISQAEVVG